MRNLLALTLFWFLGIVFVPPAYANGPRTVDAKSLDIAGVKTGMDLDEALKAVAAHFNVDANTLRRSAVTTNDSLTERRRPMFFWYENHGEKLTVYLITRIPLDPVRPLAVWQVQYELPWTLDNKAAMEQAARAKYGTPSNDPARMSLQWCDSPSRNIGVGCMSADAVLKLSDVNLTLFDRAWSTAFDQYLRDQQARKPNL